MNTTLPSIRYHSFDALRALALLLGIVFHATESFAPGMINWAVIDNQANQYTGGFFYISHIFRLSLFFMMAGFFAHMVYHKKGERRFTWERFQRILIPLVVGWIIIYPINVFVFVSGWIKTDHISIANFPSEIPRNPLILTIGHYTTGNWYKDFDLTHLWFLYYLLVIYIITLLIRKLLFSTFDHQHSIRSWMDIQFQTVMYSKFNILFLAVPTAFLLYFIQCWFGITTPSKELIPNIPVTTIYLFIFGMGWFLHRNIKLLSVFQKRWKTELTAALILSLTLTYYYLTYKSRYNTEFGWDYGIFCIGYALALWSWIFGLTGLFMRWFSAPSATMRYIADASYWLYILHLPLVVYLQVWVVYWDVHWIIKCLLINGISFPILFLTYHLFVRSTFIGKQLNGRTYPYVSILKNINLYTKKG